VSGFAGIGKVGREKLSKVLANNPRVITVHTVSETLSISTKEASRNLSRWQKNGWLFRLKRGVYIPVPLDSETSDIVIDEPFVVAEAIYHPGYIGGFSAVKHWDLSEQIIETIYYFSTKQVKDHNPVHGSTRFRIKTIKEGRNFGTKAVWYGSTKVKISDPTKTIVDIFDDPKLVGGMSVVYDIFKEYSESDYCDFELLRRYAKKMKNKTVFKRLGFIIDTKFDSPPEEFEGLKEEISAGYSKFDPQITNTIIIEKWKLKVPVSWKREYDRKE